MESLKKMYDALDFSKVDPEIKKELDLIKEKTEEFADEELIEIYRSNFLDLIEEARLQAEQADENARKNEEALKVVQDQPEEEEEEEPKVKKKKEQVIKIKKSGEEKKPKPKEGKIIKLEAQEVTIEKNDLLDPCEELITERLRLAKDSKLKEHKKKLTAELKVKYEASELDQKKYEQKLLEIEELSYAKAFTKEKGIAEVVADHLLSIFNRVITANSTQIRKSSSITLDKKVEQLKKNCKEVLEHFTGKSFPDILELFLGNKSEKFIDEFRKKAEKSSETQINKLEKYIKYQQKQSA